MPTDPKTIQWYNEHADEYTEHVRSKGQSVYHSLYEKPAMRALLPDLDGKQVLSIGCGPGEDAAHLQSAGAAKSVGIDISEQLIVRARAAHPACEFHVMDMEQLAFTDASFDVAYASLALHYLEDWSQVFTEVYRVLRPGGSFLFSCGHPTFTAMAITEDTAERRARMLGVVKHPTTKTRDIVGDYFRRRIDDTGGEQMDVTTWHKPLTEIAAEATGAGFVITALVEPTPLPAMQSTNPEQYKMLSAIPFFLILKLEKQQ